MDKISNGKKIVSGMFWRFGEKITSHAVSFVVSMVLARILMPDEFGVVAIINSFFSIAEIFVTSGLGTALIQKKDATQKDFSTIFWCNLLLSFILYVIVYFVSPLLAWFYEMPMLCPVLRVFSFRLPINAINSIQNAYVSRKMEFKKFFFATIIGTIISGIVGIQMAYAGFGVWALVGQILTNTFIDTLVLFITIKWRPTFEFSFASAKPLISFGWKVLATDLIGTIFNQLNAFIIGKKYTSSDLAFYTQGKKVPDLVNSNICATLAAVLFPAMSLSSNIDEIIELRRKSLKMLGYILFPSMLGMISVADKMIVVFFTEKWEFAIPYARIACIVALVGILGTTLIQEMKAIGRSDTTLKMELIKKPIFLIIAIISMQFGVMAIACTLIINEILAFCFNVFPVKKYIGFDLKMHILDLWPAFWMSVIMSLIVYGVGRFFTNNIISLCIQLIVGCFVYLLLSIITKNQEYLYLKKLIMSKVKK